MLPSLLSKLNSRRPARRRKDPARPLGGERSVGERLRRRGRDVSTRCPASTLPQLIAAPPLAAKFSRRFLRETLVFPVSARRRRLPARASPIRTTWRRCAPPRSCSAGRSRSRSAPTRTSRRARPSGSARTTKPSADSRRGGARARRRRRRKPARPRERRAGGARRQRPARDAPWSCARPTSTSSRSAPGSSCACASTACCAPCRRPPACCRRR